MAVDTYAKHCCMLGCPLAIELRSSAPRGVWCRNRVRTRLWTTSDHLTSCLVGFRLKAWCHGLGRVCQALLHGRLLARGGTALRCAARAVSRHEAFGVTFHPSSGLPGGPSLKAWCHGRGHTCQALRHARLPGRGGTARVCAAGVVPESGEDLSFAHSLATPRAVLVGPRLQAWCHGVGRACQAPRRARLVGRGAQEGSSAATRQPSTPQCLACVPTAVAPCL